MRRLAPLPAVLTALAALVLPVTALGAPVGAQTAPGADTVARADSEIAQLSAQADTLAGRYFEALGRLADVQQRIDEIEARIPALVAEVDDLRAATRDRAVAAYKRAGNDLGPVAGAGDPLEAARRVKWLDRLNARDDRIAERLAATSARLDAQRAELHGARAAATTALDDVKAQGQAIDALLVDAQARRQAALTPPTTLAPGPTTGATPSPTAAPGPSTTTTTAPPSGPPSAPPTYTPTPGTHPHHDEPFLVCTRTREASGRYAAYNPAGPYMGAYQFLQSTWNSAANHAGRSDLIGVPPHTASAYDQDDVAWSLYQWQGSGPWGGMCDPE